MTKPINQRDKSISIMGKTVTTEIIQFKFTYTLPQCCDNTVTEYHECTFSSSFMAYNILTCDMLGVYISQPQHKPKTNIIDLMSHEHQIRVPTTFTKCFLTSLCEPGTNFVVRDCRTKNFLRFESEKLLYTLEIRFLLLVVSFSNKQNVSLLNVRCMYRKEYFFFVFCR